MGCIVQSSPRPRHCASQVQRGRSVAQPPCGTSRVQIEAQLEARHKALSAEPCSTFLVLCLKGRILISEFTAEIIVNIFSGAFSLTSAQRA